MATYYKLDDGRYWDVASAAFVDSVSEDADWVYPMTDVWESRDEAGLYACLKYFGHPLGELARDEDFAKEARAKRDQLLAETDFMLMPDYPLSEAKRVALTAYRQALRDVPAQAGFPRQIDWPVKP